MYHERGGMIKPLFVMYHERGGTIKKTMCKPQAVVFFIAISTTCIRLRGLVSAQHGDVA